MNIPYDDSANLLKAGLGPPIKGRPVPTPEDRKKGRELCNAMHPSRPYGDFPLWYPSGCNCGTLSQLLADTREGGAKAQREKAALLLAREPASQAIADAAEVIGITAELNAAWDVLHPEKGTDDG